MDNKITELQKFMKSSPLGVSYSGPLDGTNNPVFISAVNNLTSTIKDKLSKSNDQALQQKSKTFSIMNGNNVVTGVGELQVIIKSILKQKDQQPSSDNNIKAIQSIINSNPFGINYAGPKDGIYNDELGQKLKDIESKISEVSGTSLAGKIISGNSINTDAGDLSKTFDLVNKYLSFKKSQK